MTSRITDPAAPRALTPGVRALLSAQAVRAHAQQLLERALAGRLEHWVVDLDRLGPTADFVTTVVRERYPQLKVPVHSRWRHFVFEARDRWAERVAASNWKSADAAARAAFDLVITSVLLDAGAGAGWRYQDPVSHLSAARSEGLALASLRWFESGGLSADPTDPLRVDASVLRQLDAESIRTAFQAREDNPLLGVEGRAALLNRFASVMQSRPELFAIADVPRPGGLFDALRARAVHAQLPAAAILQILLEALGPIWQSRPQLGGIALGDCWPHPALQGEHPEDGYVPLHKLSQWLTYSLIEPLQQAGITVSRVHELTGLAEYRNGGLLVDMGVLSARDPAQLSRTHAVADPLVVGWRALTVALLDQLAPMIGQRLGLTPEQFPLASALEGGTWAAGRIIARTRRAGGGPPFQILSDGTVF